MCMYIPSPATQFFLELAKAQTILARKFDAGLNGLGLNEFMILYHLGSAEKETMRRVDLAEKVGLTQSGITRILAPMEKVGLVKRKACEDDARVSFVALTSGGKRKLDESTERAELLSEDIVKIAKLTHLEKLTHALELLNASRL